MVWATCKASSSNLLIGVCYRPPDCGISFIHNLRSSISAAVDYCSPSDIYLFGDFNFPQIDWANLSSPSHAATEFINLTLDFYLFQVISQNTRGSNILDLVLTTAPETIGQVMYLDGFSDHKLLQFDILVPCLFPGQSTKMIRDYSKANYGEINAELTTFFNEVFFLLRNHRSTEENWLLLKHKLSALIQKYVPLITISNDKTNPWFNKALQRLRNKKKRLYRKAKSTSSLPLLDKYKQCLKTYCTAITTAKNKYFTHDLPSLLQTNPRKFWQVISPENKQDPISLHNTDGLPLTDTECPTAFNNFFASVFTKEDQ